MRRCLNFQTLSTTLQRYASCGRVRFCCRNCQVKHLRGSHKNECKAAGQEPAADERRSAADANAEFYIDRWLKLLLPRESERDGQMLPCAPTACLSSGAPVAEQRRPMHTIFLRCAWLRMQSSLFYGRVRVFGCMPYSTFPCICIPSSKGLVTTPCCFVCQGERTQQHVLAPLPSMKATIIRGR